MNISIIIPALNEQEHIGRALDSARSATSVEIIVVDGGSKDATSRIAAEKGARVVASPPGRAGQMNAGARVAGGDVFLFLHADTELPPGYESIITRELQNEKIACGAFRLAVSDQGVGFRMIEKFVFLRSIFFKLPYGDQGLYLRKTVFNALGGFPDYPILEDLELVRRAKRKGAIAIAAHSVLTSGRHWRKKGIIRTTIINQAILLGYLFGIRFEILKGWYGNG